MNVFILRDLPGGPVGSTQCVSPCAPYPLCPHQLLTLPLSFPRPPGRVDVFDKA